MRTGLAVLLLAPLTAFLAAPANAVGPKSAPRVLSVDDEEQILKEVGAVMHESPDQLLARIGKVPEQVPVRGSPEAEAAVATSTRAFQHDRATTIFGLKTVRVRYIFQAGKLWHIAFVLDKADPAQAKAAIKAHLGEADLETAELEMAGWGSKQTRCALNLVPVSGSVVLAYSCKRGK